MTSVKMDQNAFEWYGMNKDFEDLSFNVLGVENGTVFEVSRKNHNILLWAIWADKIRGRHSI